MEWRGKIVKKEHRSIYGIDNMVSAPRWGDVTGWQVGCCCLCHRLRDQGRHAEIPATQTPGSEAPDCSRGHGDTWTHGGTHKWMCAHTYALHGCKVTSHIANYRHSASVLSRGSKLHGSTTTRAMCPAVICQTNYLSWACNCSENRYSGNCVVSCNVNWCFPSIFRQDESRKDCSADIRGSIRPSSQTLVLKIYTRGETSAFWEEKHHTLMLGLSVSVMALSIRLATSWIYVNNQVPGVCCIISSLITIYSQWREGTLNVQRRIVKNQ